MCEIHWSVIVAIAVCVIWLIPRFLSGLLVLDFDEFLEYFIGDAVLFGFTPIAIFLAIWGGIFWW